MNSVQLSMVDVAGVLENMEDKSRRILQYLTDPIFDLVDETRKKRLFFKIEELYKENPCNTKEETRKKRRAHLEYIVIFNILENFMEEISGVFSKKEIETLKELFKYSNLNTFLGSVEEK